MTLILISVLLNVLLAIWLLRLIDRIARLEQDAADLRIKLRLAHGKKSSYAKEIMPELRRNGL